MKSVVGDLLMPLAGWGGLDGGITGDGTTNVGDLLALLVGWRDCP